jgi:hypothetical protein
LQSLSLAADALGQPFVVWSNSASGSPQIYLRADTLPVNRVMYTSAAIPLAEVLLVNTVAPGDIIVVDAATHTASATLTAQHSGIFIQGSGEEFSRISGQLTLDGVHNLTLSRIALAGVSALATSGLEISSNSMGALLLDGTIATRLVANNLVSDAIALTLRDNVDALIEGNRLHGDVAAVHISAAETNAQIAGNRITSTGTGVRLLADLVGG